MDNINQRIIEKAKRKLDSLFESYAMIAEDRVYVRRRRDLGGTYSS